MTLLLFPLPTPHCNVEAGDGPREGRRLLRQRRCDAAGHDLRGGRAGDGGQGRPASTSMGAGGLKCKGGSHRFPLSHGHTPHAPLPSHRTKLLREANPHVQYWPFHPTCSSPHHQTCLREADASVLAQGRGREGGQLGEGGGGVGLDAGGQGTEGRAGALRWGGREGSALFSVIPVSSCAACHAVHPATQSWAPPLPRAHLDAREGDEEPGAIAGIGKRKLGEGERVKDEAPRLRPALPPPTSGSRLCPRR